MAHIRIHIEVKERSVADAFVQVLIEEAVPHTPHGHHEFRDVDYAAIRPSLEAIVHDATARALSQLEDDHAATRARGDVPSDGDGELALSGSDGPGGGPRLRRT